MRVGISQKKQSWRIFPQNIEYTQIMMLMIQDIMRVRVNMRYEIKMGNFKYSMIFLLKDIRF